MDAISFHSNISKSFDNYYNHSTLFKERFNIWSKIIDKYLNKGDRVFDAGCGSGIFAFYIATKGNKVTAVDGSAGMIKLCREKLFERPNLEIDFLLERLPLRTNLIFEKFNLVISSSVLEYVDNFEQCLKDFKKLLKSQGILIISLPNKKSLYRKLEKIAFYFFKRPKYFEYVKNMSTIKEFNGFMTRMGFDEMETRYYSSDSFLEKIFKYSFIPRRYRSSLFLGVYKNH